MKTSLIKFTFAVAFLSVTLLFSCIKDEESKEVTCRDFDSTELIKYYPGKVGDIVSFKRSSDASLINFTIAKKDIYHSESYMTNTGCSCYDRWRVQLESERDTIILITNAPYLENYAPEIDMYCQIEFDNEITDFTSYDVTVEDTHKVNDVTFEKVIRFGYDFDDDAKFKSIYIAKSFGIIEMVRADGETFINENLTVKSDTTISAFTMNDLPCE